MIFLTRYSIAGKLPWISNSYLLLEGIILKDKKPWKDNFSNISTRFVIPSIAKNNIIKKLQKIGINQSFIMPSLDSLCRDIVYIHKMRYPHGIK